jgi:ABC-type nitrate/sulfonate/bicarbonate transport system permease component
VTIRVRTARSARGTRGRFFEGIAGERLIGFASPVLLLALWEAAGRAGALDQRFFPAPSAIAGTFVALLQSGELVEHTLTSLGRIAIGFTVGAVPGLVLGIAMGLSRLVRAALKPVVGALYPVPKTAIFPLLLLVFGIGEPSKYAIVAIGVFFLVLINTMAGVLGIEPVYLDVGRNFGAGRFQVFRTIALPGALPLIFTGIQLAWGNALILIVVAEILGARSGIGYFIQNSYQTFQVERMYAGLLVISFIGYASFLALDELERRLIPWKAGRTG